MWRIAFISLSCPRRARSRRHRCGDGLTRHSRHCAGGEAICKNACYPEDNDPYKEALNVRQIVDHVHTSARASTLDTCIAVHVLPRAAADHGWA
jgi:hypothetical protein